MLSKSEVVLLYFCRSVHRSQLLPLTKTCLFVNAEHSLSYARDWLVYVHGCWHSTLWELESWSMIMQVSNHQPCILFHSLSVLLHVYLSSLPSLNIHWMSIFLCNFQFLRNCRFLLDYRYYKVPWFCINGEINGCVIRGMCNCLYIWNLYTVYMIWKIVIWLLWRAIVAYIRKHGLGRIFWLAAVNRKVLSCISMS